MSTWTLIVTSLCLSFVAPSLQLEQQMAHIPCSMLAVRQHSHNNTFSPLGPGVKRDNQGMCSVPLSSLSPTVDEMLEAEPTDLAAYVSRDNECRGVLLDMDMCLTPAQQQLMDHYRRLDARSPRRWKRKALTALSSRWSKKEIPYEIKKGKFNAKEVETILSSMRAWEKETCITFRPAETSDKDKAVINTGSGCFSRIGRVGGEQEVTLGTGNCRTKKVIMHELGHALGLIHEHQRSDRDTYVYINMTSVRPMFVSQFEKISKRLVETDEVQYDYLSLMHYGKSFFSVDGKKVTIKTLDPKYQDVIGRVESLSFSDIKSINIMYNCAEFCPRRLNCIDGGYQGPSCACVCPKPFVSCESSEPLPSYPSVVSGTKVPATTSTSPNSTTSSASEGEASDLIGGNPWADMQGQGPGHAQHDLPILKVTDRQTQGNNEVIYMSTGNISAALATLVPEKSQTIDLSSPASYQQTKVGGPSITRLYLTDLAGDGSMTAPYPSDSTGQPSPSPSTTANYSSDSFRQKPMTSGYPSDTVAQNSPSPSVIAQYPSDTARQPSMAARYPSDTARQTSIRVRFTSNPAGQPSVASRYPSDNARQPSMTARYPSDNARQPSITARFSSDTAAQPSITARFPSDTDAQPSMTARFSSDTAAQPSMTARYPSDNARQPSMTARYPSDTARQPSMTARFSSDTAAQPSMTARYPSDTAAQPSMTARFSSDTDGQPSMIARYPSDTAAQPSITARYPSDTAAQPSMTARFSSDTARQPSMIARYPSDTAAQPSITARFSSDTAAQPSMIARYPSDTAGQPSVLEQYSLNPVTQVQISSRYPSDTDRQTSITAQYLSNPDKRPSITARYPMPHVRQPSMPAGFTLTSGRRNLRLGRTGRHGVDRRLQSVVKQNPRSKYVPYANRQTQTVKLPQRLPDIPGSRNGAFAGAFANRLAPQSQLPDAEGERFRFHIPGDVILSALHDAVKEINGRMPTPSASWAAQQQPQPGPQQLQPQPQSQQQQQQQPQRQQQPQPQPQTQLQQQPQPQPQTQRQRQQQQQQQPQAPEPLQEISPDNPPVDLLPPTELLESQPVSQAQSQYENRTQPQKQTKVDSQTQPQLSSLQSPSQSQPPQSQVQIPPEIQSETQPQLSNLKSLPQPQPQSQSQIPTEIESQTQEELSNLQSPPQPQSQSQIPSEIQSQLQPLSQLQSQPPPHQRLSLQPRSRRPQMYSQQRFPTPQRLQFRRNGPQQNLAGSRMPQTRRQNPLRTQRPVRLEASVPRVQPQGVRPSVPERQTVHRNKVKLLKSQRPTGKATPMDRQWPQRQDEFRGQSRGQVQGRPGMVRSTGTFRPTGSNSGQRTRGLRCFDLVTSCRHFADANSCGKSNFVRQNCRRTCQIC